MAPGTCVNVSQWDESVHPTSMLTRGDVHRFEGMRRKPMSKTNVRRVWHPEVKKDDEL